MHKAAMFRRLRRVVEHRAAAGRTLDSIERTVIDPSSLSDEQKACLWLIAQHEIDLHRAKGSELREGALFRNALTFLRAR